MDDEKSASRSSDVLKALHALMRAAKDVEAGPIAAICDANCSYSPAIKALLELEKGSNDILAFDPHLSNLSQLLSQFKNLVFIAKDGCAPDSCSRKDRGLLRSIIMRRTCVHSEISSLSGSMAKEIQSWIDRETIERLVRALRSPKPTELALDHDDKDRTMLLVELEDRLSKGFDISLQDALLRAGAFSVLEATLANNSKTKLVREKAASALLALVRFNKAVFVGPVLMGTAIASLVSMSSAMPVALRAINGLIAAIRSPLIDELLARGEISPLVALLSLPLLDDLQVQVLALDCALEIAYYGRKEAIDAMLAEGVIKRLMALQRSEFGGALIEMEDKDNKSSKAPFVRPFASCVARWTVQLEVGEGLRQREKRSVKREIVSRLKEASICEAEAATVLAEVLWGSTDW